MHRAHVQCVQCGRESAAMHCAISLATLKAMLFDRVTGHARIRMPQESAAASPSSSSADEQRACSEIMLPLCDSGARRGAASAASVVADTDVTLDDTYDVDRAHWVCASCMARAYAQAPSPLVAYDYAAVVPRDGAQTTATAAFVPRRAPPRCAPTLLQQRVDMANGRHASPPSVAAAPAHDRCPACGGAVSVVAVAMFLAIVEAQHCDYERMRQCWLNECTRNVRLRKLMRDLQHYLLFDEAMRDARLRLERTPHAFRVHVERRVDVPPHHRRDDEPSGAQTDTITYTTVRARAQHQWQVHETAPTIAGAGEDAASRGGTGVAQRTADGDNLARDHGLHEPRERWLFEALGLHNDFDDATRPINGQALTRSEHRALRRAIRAMR